MNHSQQKNVIYFPNLDGLRFFCFFAVFLYHAFATDISEIKANFWYQLIEGKLVSSGHLGVNCFFVLSGFLITFLLLQELQLTGKIDIKNFYVRRILRIWPMFYACVLFGFVGFPFLKKLFGQISTETASLVSFLTFTNNLDMVYHGPPDASTLSVLWSVAIEEQFYLVWPVILSWVPVRHYPKIFALIILQSVIYRIYIVFNYSGLERMNHLDHHTLSCIGDMAIGAWGAWAVCYQPNFLNKIQTINKMWIYSIYLLFFTLFFTRKSFLEEKVWFQIADRIIHGCIFLFFILEQNYAEQSFFKFSNWKKITDWGKMTYGLYCLHMIAFLIAMKLNSKLGLNKRLWQVMILDTGLAFVLSLTIAKLSYEYFEKPFLKLKDRFAYIKKA
ncbi:MAG: acyltransferase [Bacteroidia bacterium]|nr:acyltransferase [Bacteroidia bacterium]